jgi:hypothetical protein
MSFDYSAAKAALKKAGHVVSAGPTVMASDIKELVTFGRRNFGLKGSLVRRGLLNPSLLPKGFPGIAASTPVSESAPATPVVAETPVAAPVTPEATAEETPKAKKKAAAVGAPAQVAAGEQAAQ